MKRRLVIDQSKLIEIAVVIAALLGLGCLTWLSTVDVPLFFYYGYVVVSAIVGATLYITLRKQLDQPLRRRMLLVLLAASLFGAAALRDPVFALFQIEGLFFDLLAGIFFAAVIHYLIAKVVGPLFFGRIWCGWACWTAALLDLLPYKRSPGRLHRAWGWVRYLHFAASLALVVILWVAYAYRPGVHEPPALIWFLGGNLLYDVIGVGMALLLKDNRAFCKYACPIPVILKATSSFSLLKIKGDASRCCENRVCEKVCPMDIRIADYLHTGQRITSTECILCQACMSVCPEDALTLSFGVDGRGEELLRERM